MADVRTVLVVGLGSMGKRRLRNLSSLGIASLIGFDPRADRRDEAREQTPQVRTVERIEDGFDADPQAVVVSTPPDLHVRFARESVRRGVPVFTEASVVDHELSGLAHEAREAGVLVAPSCTMRFWPAIRFMKRTIEEGRIGQVLAYTYHSGQYLPDWHPWEDYRAFYAGKRETGAGREIVPFELIWLTWLVGPIDSVTAMKGKVSELDVDIDDVYQVVIRHKPKALGHLLVDVVAREAVRRCTILGSEGTLHWEWSTKTVTLYEAGTRQHTVFKDEPGAVQRGYIHSEAPYVEEMRAFVDAIERPAAHPWPYPLDEDMRILALLSAIETSSDSGRRVKVS